MKICFFCSSGETIEKKYLILCDNIAEEMAKHHWTVISGGADLGCMKRLVNNSQKLNNYTIGVLPAFFDKKLINFNNNEIIITADMQSRKKKLIEISDAFVILPGGIGTMDEFFEIITLNSLSVTNKPVFLFNFEGFYDELLNFFEKIQNLNFANPKRKLFETVTTTKELFKLLTEYKKL